LAFECVGLLCLWLAAVPAAAHAGAALTGFGFSLVFPALGVEAVRNVPEHNRGSALGVYTAFVDLSLGISGPIAGVIVHVLGYPPIFLFAAAMAGSSMAILITRYLKRAEPNTTANSAGDLVVEIGGIVPVSSPIVGHRPIPVLAKGLLPLDIEERSGEGHGEEKRSGLAGGYARGSGS
jgi:MFS transporter